MKDFLKGLVTFLYNKNSRKGGEIILEKIIYTLKPGDYCYNKATHTAYRVQLIYCSGRYDTFTFKMQNMRTHNYVSFTEECLLTDFKYLPNINNLTETYPLKKPKHKFKTGDKVRVIKTSPKATYIGSILPRWQIDKTFGKNTRRSRYI